MTRACVTMMLAASVAACSPVPRQGERLNASAVCCTSASEFDFVQLSPNGETQVVISERSPVYAFPTGKSYFAAFALPVTRGPAVLKIKTVRLGLLVFDSQVFCPAFTFYDREKQSTKTERAWLVYRPARWIGKGYWSSQVRIPAGAEYLAVHTAADDVGTSLEIEGMTPGYAYATGTSFVYVPPYPSKQSYPCGQVGELSLLFTGN